MNEEARKEAEKVLNRMRQEGKESHEYGLLYDYLDFVTSLSWKAPEFTPIDLKQAEEILDEDHYGLKKVKDRIIQQLGGHGSEPEAVRLHSPLCRSTRHRQDQHRPEYRPRGSEENTCGSVSEVSGMKPRSADTAGLTLERCPAGSWKP